MSDDFRWAPLIAELERELRKRNMREHLARLAEFSVGYERQSRRLMGLARPPWTMEMLVELTESVDQASDLFVRVIEERRERLLQPARQPLRESTRSSQR